MRKESEMCAKYYQQRQGCYRNQVETSDHQGGACTGLPVAETGHHGPRMPGSHAACAPRVRSAGLLLDRCQAQAHTPQLRTKPLQGWPSSGPILSPAGLVREGRSRLRSRVQL